MLIQAKALLMGYDFKLKYVKTIPGKRYYDGYSAEVFIDTRYKEVDIALSGKFFDKWKRKDYQDMVDVLIHELAHIYTDPYYEFFYDLVPKKLQKQVEHLNEMQTEKISRLIRLNIKPKEYLL